MTDSARDSLIEYHLGRERVKSLKGSDRDSKKSWSPNSSIDDDRNLKEIRRAGYVKPMGHNTKELTWKLPTPPPEIEYVPEPIPEPVKPPTPKRKVSSSSSSSSSSSDKEPPRPPSPIIIEKKNWTFYDAYLEVRKRWGVAHFRTRLIQRTWRAYLKRVIYPRKNRAATIIQRWWRAMMVKLGLPKQEGLFLIAKKS